MQRLLASAICGRLGGTCVTLSSFCHGSQTNAHRLSYFARVRMGMETVAPLLGRQPAYVALIDRGFRHSVTDLARKPVFSASASMTDSQTAAGSGAAKALGL